MVKPQCGNCGHAESEHHQGKTCLTWVDSGGIHYCRCEKYRPHTRADDPPHVPSMRLAELVGTLAYTLEALEECLSLDTAGELRLHYLSECNHALDAIRQFNVKGE